MWTIYEQVQRAVDHIEDNLVPGVTAEQAAEVAAMSVRSLHQYFPVLTGFRVGEYQRKRRLSDAAEELLATDATVLDIALSVGYETHESFTRAFHKEYGLPPREFRARATLPGVRLEPIDLVGEVKMGVLTRKLSDMQVVRFDGYRPDPEESARAAMRGWLRVHADDIGPHRVFGHNIDREGNLSYDPHNEGYRLLVTVPPDLEIHDAPRGTIAAGTFVVTGIEGSFTDDPSGSWVGEGWQRMNTMLEHEGLEIPPSPSWFEELLEPTIPGRTRFDLYLEVR